MWRQPLVYPNPTSDVFTINPEGLNAISVDLFSESGQLIYHHQLTNTKSILISDLTDGLYFYKIVTEQGQTIQGKIQKI
ncbi:MAG: T9SS C-terminal target domain-containing protein [Bacteroidetes bacterium]|nr:T9SS C-terminal target domain-containing protein [Bacteroidota bacterium]